MALLAQERQKPGVQATQAPAPAASLKKPGEHAKPAPVSVVATVCDALTVPEHKAAVHGLGVSVKMVVPSATPEPVTTMPTEREPDVTPLMVSPVPEMVPVTTPVAVPTGQRAPAGHWPVQASVGRLLAAP